MYSFLLRSALPWACRQLFGLRHGKGFSDCIIPTGVPAGRSGGKKPLLNGRKDGINTFFRRETFFLFSCWSCSRRLRGEIGRAEDPFLPSSGRKKLAEAGPPGKRPVEAKAGNCIGMYKKHFINSLKYLFYQVYQTFLYFPSRTWGLASDPSGKPFVI
jgi:hypothetical protein